MTKSLFIIAGELSGDRLGGALMTSLNAQDDINFQGIGGPMMTAAGLKSLFDMNELSVMGLVEVLPKIPKLLARVRQTVDAVIAANPDALITIDSPDFCLRVAKKAREKLPNLKVIHYVAPSVWAWRPERAEKMAKHVDHVLALLPFEPPYMHEAGMSCDFVGHPVVAETQPTQAAIESVRSKVGSNTGRLVTILPGSRKSEVARMGPIFGQVIKQLKQQHGDLKFAVVAAPSVTREVNTLVQHWGRDVTLMQSDGNIDAWEAEKRALYTASSFALATSGTVSLELAAQSCPMVIAYKANWATTRMVKKMAMLDTANLVNILTDTRVIPEFLFENAAADKIGTACDAILQSNGLKQKQACELAMKKLGRGSPDAKDWAANSVLRFLSEK